MRLAVLILGIFATIAITFQSCALGVLGTVASNNHNLGTQGLAVALFYILGTAFAYGLPFVAAPMFLLAAAMGLSSTNFPDLKVWGWIAVALSVMCIAGGIARRRARRRGAVVRTEGI
jgi:hypothetical protein